MADYQITISRSAQKELKSLPIEISNRISPRIRALASNPRPDGCRKLVGKKNRWRLRVSDHRVIYSINDDTRIIDVIAVRHRSEVYE